MPSKKKSSSKRRPSVSKRNSLARRKSITRKESRENEEYLLKREYDLVKDNTLTVSVYANFYPVAYKSAGGHLRGLDVDIMTLFAKASGLKLKFVEKDKFNGIWNDPRRGVSDVSISGIGLVPERLNKTTEWTMPYFHVMRTVVYNKKDPIKHFPQDVHDTVLGTYKSTGWLDAQLRAKKLHKDHFMQKGTTDEEDIEAVKNGEVQGIMRGSFVGQSIVKRYPKKLGMTKPWEIDPTLVTSDGEIFAYPTRLGSGLAVALSSFLTELLMNGTLEKLLVKYHLE